MPHDTVKEAAAAVAPRQIVALPGTDWRFWRSFAVRGAGFPASVIEGLTAPRAVAAAEAYFAARAHRAAQIEPAMTRLAAEIRALPPGDRARLRDLRTRIRMGEAVDPSEGADACAGARASAEAVQAREAFAAAYARDAEIVNERLVELSRDPRFREAMLWQSGESTRLIGDALGPDGRSKRRRRALKQIAMRAQRYCAKNDTIGFFGPFGWGHFDEAAAGIETAPGPGTVAYREVFFEGWSIDTLARCLESQHGHNLRPWIAPRIKAGVWIHDGRAWRPLRTPLVLNAAEQATLAVCDGIRTATEIARAVRSRPVSSALPAASDEATFAILDRLVAADIISWHLDVAPQLRPERELRARLDRIGDAALRDRCLADLDDLLRARHSVAAAAGDVDTLDTALTDLETCFTRLTDQPSTRRGGEMYAGRTLVYEDCRRDDTVRVGASVLADLAAPLDIMLDAARWASAEVGAVLRQQLRVCFTELQAQQPGDIDCHAFVSYVVSTIWLQGGHASLFDATVARVQRLWDDILGTAWDPSAPRVTLRPEDVAARARVAFPARHVDWALGRYVSPDLMIAASSLDAIRRGDYGAVLGEIHGGNSLSQMIDVATHPHPPDLFEAAAEDNGDETVVIRAVPRAVWVPRLTLAVVLPHYWRYQFGDDPPNHPPCRELPAGKLVITERDGAIVARARDGSLQFDAVELFGNPLLDEVNRVMGEFRPRLSHTPRVSLGKLTIARERWQFLASELAFRTIDDPAQQFLDLRDWGRAHGMPRCVFVKAPSEMKPWLLDFDSPVYAEIFTAIVKNLPDDSPVGIVEMRPGLQDLWLVDRDGRRFTCELRCAARHRDA